jgi:hypothetical protein
MAAGKQSKGCDGGSTSAGTRTARGRDGRPREGVAPTGLESASRHGNVGSGDSGPPKGDTGASVLRRGIVPSPGRTARKPLEARFVARCGTGA